MFLPFAAYRLIQFAPLKRERISLIIATILVTISRLWGLARSPWDWDELLFLHGMRGFDVPAHHPHPPGFPLFIFFGKALTLIGVEPFHALQALNLLAGIALVPVMCYFGRAIGLPFVTALSGATILGFLPNVWLFGEGGFSDVPSAVLGVLAAALLFDSKRDPRLYWIGAIVLGIAAGFRPQNLLIGLVPALYASFHQRVWRVIVAALIGMAIIAIAYGGAAMASGGWEAYRYAVTEHEKYIRTTDSFRSPSRPPLWRLADDFFGRPFYAMKINIAMALLSAIAFLVALFRRNRSVWLAILTFGPFAISAWLLLDHFSASRFSIAYMPLSALLTAEGIRIVTRRLEPLAAAAFAGALIVWCAPLIRTPATSVSPPMQALQWIRKNVNRSTATIHVHGSMQPYTDYYLTDYRCVLAEMPPIGSKVPDSWYVSEGISSLGAGHTFAWEHGRLWNVARQRYFETSVAPVASLARFAEGWHDEEGQGTIVWRWMGAESRTLLPPILGPAKLRVQFFVPLDIMDEPPAITFVFNGVEIDRVTPMEAVTVKTYAIPEAAKEPNELVIRTSNAPIPARIGKGGDERALGLRLEAIEWSPERKPEPRK